MSRLKINLAKKILKSLNIKVDPEDISFSKNGRRMDVVKWSFFGYECFSSAEFCLRSGIDLSVSEMPGSFGSLEIYAIDKDIAENEVKHSSELHPFSSFRKN